jgi:RNA polymerase sigma-70 factor, ECF subfamily
MVGCCVPVRGEFQSKLANEMGSQPLTTSDEAHDAALRQGPVPDSSCWPMSNDDLVHGHWDAVYRLAYRLAGGVHDAEELTQETFLRAIDRKETFATGTNLRAWLLRIATNLFLDGRRRRTIIKLEPLTEGPPRDDPPPWRGMEGAELKGLLDDAVRRLPEQQRIVLLLRAEQGLSFREIGQIVSVGEETARWHMLQARRQLMKDLDGKL